MKIVIDIPESDYELIKNDGVQSHIACVDEAIRNGIVLHKLLCDVLTVIPAERGDSNGVDH